MNLEGMTLRVLTKELRDHLENGRIYKIFMPSRNSLLLQITLQTHTENLLIDLSGDSPLVTLPERLPERPDRPPSFCMLLRKHLEEGRITSITQLGLDRVLVIGIDLIGRERKIITKKLILELTGKNSNIIFVDETGLIVDALRHIGKKESRVRQILPNKPYEAPPLGEGISFLEGDPHAIREACVASGKDSLTAALIAVTVGIGKESAQETVYRAGFDKAPALFSLKEAAALEKAIFSIQEEVKAHLTGEIQTVMAQIDGRNRMKHLTAYEAHVGEKMTARSFPSLLAALLYSASLVPIQIPEKDTLQKLVLSHMAKTKKKQKALEKDLLRAEDADTQKIMADTLMAYGTAIKKGEQAATLQNIYTNEPLTIALQPQLTAIENAQAYYKRYNKYKRAVSEIHTQQAETDSVLAYLESLDASLDTAITKGDVSEIKEEIIALGLLPKPRKKMAVQSKSVPLKVVLSEDTLLYVGKNNKQNDYVTFKLGRAHDLWFHAKNIPGSHVILKTTLPSPREEDILRAAQIAAYYSKGRFSSRVSIDCTQRRYVKKPNGAKPGFVIFTNQKTINAEPKKEP